MSRIPILGFAFLGAACGGSGAAPRAPAAAAASAAAPMDMIGEREASGFEATQEVLRQAAHNLDERATSRLGGEQPTVAIGPFQLVDEDGCALRETLRDDVVEAADGVFERLVRQDANVLEALEQRIRLENSDLFDPAYAAQAGRFLGAEAVVIGRVSRRVESGRQTVRLQLELVHVARAQLLASTSTEVASDYVDCGSPVCSDRRPDYPSCMTSPPGVYVACRERGGAGELEITSHPATGPTIYVGDEWLGTTPLTLRASDVPSGTAALRLEHGGQRASRDMPVVVNRSCKVHFVFEAR